MRVASWASCLPLSVAVLTPSRASTQQPPDNRVMTMALTGEAFTNLEMLFHDYQPYPMHESGGTYMRAEPALLKELVWAAMWRPQVWWAGVGERARRGARGPVFRDGERPRAAVRGRPGLNPLRYRSCRPVNDGGGGPTPAPAAPAAPAAGCRAPAP